MRTVYPGITVHQEPAPLLLTTLQLVTYVLKEVIAQHGLVAPGHVNRVAMRILQEALNV